MTKNSTLQAILWAANVVVWGCVLIVDRNMKSEKKRLEQQTNGSFKVDLSGPERIQIAYQKKNIPEFTIYQV